MFCYDLNNAKFCNMKRDIIKIDEELCNGCGLCIPNCHEGALQIIENKARLVSDLMCDGLGACIGHCPQGAITVEHREAAPYNETEVMQQMIVKGQATVIAHLKHLKDHDEKALVQEGFDVLKAAQASHIDIKEVFESLHQEVAKSAVSACPSAQSQSFVPASVVTFAPTSQAIPSALQHWPVQMHLINPNASHFKHSDLLLAADCTAFTLGGFHQNFLKGKTLAIACPKLDSGLDVYFEKLVSLINDAEIKSLTLMVMEVPCCGGLTQLARRAIAQAEQAIPLRQIMVSIRGEILSDKII